MTSGSWPTMEVLTMVYNEEKILPYFLKHYEHYDRINVLYETDSDDRSLEILNSHENVVVRPVHIAGGLDDMQKVALVNDAIAECRADWLVVVDSDELIFPEGHEDVREFLRRNDAYNLIMAFMFQVYRHKDDKDLDPTLPPVPQRVHGDPDIYSTVQEPNRDCNAHSIKPSVIRPRDGFKLAPGNHVVADHGELRISQACFYGAHWQMADPEIALHRRLQRRKRMSEVNKRLLMGFQHYNVDESYILAECRRWENAPVIPQLIAERK